MMRCCGRLPLFLIVPALAVALSLAGCGKDTTPTIKAGGDGDKSKTGSSGETPAPAGALVEVAGKGLGTLKGKVIYDGDPPKRADIGGTMTGNDKERCLMGDHYDQEWMVNEKNKGVKNAVIFLRAPKGKYLKVPDDQKKQTETVKVDQPYCAFEPHVVAYFPSYFDGKKQTPTGEKLEVLNSATMNHNTAWSGNTLFNKGENQIIQPKKHLDVNAKPSQPSKVGEDLIKLKCDIHKWMTGYIWVFDTPYYAVTKDDGSFEIKNVPTGVELEVVYWHESFGDSPKAAKAETKTLKDGENTLPDIKVKK